jgi:hypothetical protein
VLSAVDLQEPWRVEGVDVEDTPAAEALEELFRPVNPTHDDGWDGTTPAEALTWAHASFVTLQAFLSLRERVRDGETFAVESAAVEAPCGRPRSRRCASPRRRRRCRR